MGLSIGVYRDRIANSVSSHNGLRMLADWTLDAYGVNFSTDEFGFGGCSFSVDMPTDQAQTWKNSPRAYRLILSDGAFTVWDGRIEKITTTDSGIQVGALGLFREYEDAVTSSLWSSTLFSDWRIATGYDMADRHEGRFQFDFDGRLYITMIRGTQYLNNIHIGTMIFKVPDFGTRHVAEVIFSYEAVLPVPTTVRLVRSDAGGGSAVTEWSITGTAALQTGTVTATFGATDPWVYFDMLQTGGGITPAQETGSWYFTVTDIRVKTTTSATVLASDVLISIVDALNGSSAITHRDIETSTMDLKDLIFEDTTLLDMVQVLRTRATTTDEWVFEVWEGRNVTFRPVESDDMPVYYVDDAQVAHERDYSRLISRVTTVYEDDLELHGKGRNTSVLSAKGRDRHGGYRYTLHSASTADIDQAIDEATQILNTHQNIITAGTITIRGDVFDEHGAVIPKWRVRKGSKLVLRRNHIINYWEDADSVIIGRTSYNVDTDELSVEPLDMPVTMETALANTSVFQDWNNPTFRNWG